MGSGPIRAARASAAALAILCGAVGILLLFFEFAETQLEERRHSRLFDAHPGQVFGQIGLRLRFQGSQQGAIEIAVENGRVDITAAANRRGISKMIRPLFYGPDSGAFSLR